MSDVGIMTTCEKCGSSKHYSDNCPTEALLKVLNDEPTSKKLPDKIIVIDAAELFGEEE